MTYKAFALFIELEDSLPLLITSYDDMTDKIIFLLEGEKIVIHLSAAAKVKFINHQKNHYAILLVKKS